MKKLSQQQVTFFIENGTLTCYSSSGTPYTGGIQLINKEQLDLIKNFPNELKHFIEDEDFIQQYIVPDSIELFSSDEIIQHKEIFIEWLKWAILFNSDTSNYSTRDKLLQYGKKILALAFHDYNEKSLLSLNFWNKFSFGYNDKVSNLSNQFSSLFENEEDIQDFQKILPDEFKIIKNRSNIDNNIMYYTYIKSVRKLAADYSLPTLPLIIRSRLNKSNSELCHLELLSILHKYKFNAVEDIILKLYNTSSNSKIVIKAKELLLKNNALKIQDKLILSEENKTIYHKTIEVNILALKEKTYDNLIVTTTLINLIHNYLQTQFFIVKEISNYSITFEVKADNINELEQFKETLNQCLIYTFDIFMTADIFNQFSKNKLGKKISHENNKNIQKIFEDGFFKFCSKESLEQNLKSKNETHKTHKI